jgi:hypothetical protein
MLHQRDQWALKSRTNGQFWGNMQNGNRALNPIE